MYRSRHKLNPDPLYVTARILERSSYMEDHFAGETSAAKGEERRQSLKAVHEHSSFFHDMNKDSHDVQITPRMLAIARESLKMKVALLNWEEELASKLDSLNRTRA